MSRIRTVKPEFFSSVTVARVSIPARLLFIGLWTEADDHGRLLGNARRLLGIIFPHNENITEAHVRGWIDELVFEGLLVRYETRGADLLWVPGFSEHQKIDKRRPSRLPEPPVGRTLSGAHQQTLLPANMMESAPISRQNHRQTSHLSVTSEEHRETSDGTSVLNRWDVCQDLPVLDQGPPIRGQGTGTREGEAPAPTPQVLPPLQPDPTTPRVDPRLIQKAKETGNVGALLAAVTHAVRPKRSETIIGMAEATSMPESADALCASPWGREHAARFPALDGNNGRPSLVELVREMWPRFLDRCEHGTPTDALRSLSKWLSEDYPSHKNSKAYDDRAAERGGAHRVVSTKAATWEEIHAQCVRFAKVRGVDEPPPLKDTERWKEWASANQGVFHEAKRAARAS